MCVLLGSFLLNEKVARSTAGITPNTLNHFRHLPKWNYLYINYHILPPFCQEKMILPRIQESPEGIALRGDECVNLRYREDAASDQAKSVVVGEQDFSAIAPCKDYDMLCDVRNSNVILGVDGPIVTIDVFLIPRCVAQSIGVARVFEVATGDGEDDGAVGSDGCVVLGVDLTIRCDRHTGRSGPALPDLPPAIFSTMELSDS